MRDVSLSEILDDILKEDVPFLSDPLTVWFPPGTKERFSALQEKTERRFVRALREAMLKVLELAEKRVG